MAATDRKPSTALSHLEQLAGAAGKYSFSAAMRIVECAFAERPRLGESQRPSEDAVRLAQQATLGFSGMPIERLERGGPAGRYGTLSVRYPGLFGPNGPLPLHFTEYVVDRAKHGGDRTLRDFINVFQHRLLSMYWRAISSAQPVVQLDRPEDDRFATYYSSLAGLQSLESDALDPRIPRARRHWVSHFARPVRNTEGLEAILSGFFETPVCVEEFVGDWVDLPSAGLALGGANSLGSDTFLGESFWDCSQSIRVVFTSLDLEHYERLLPSGESWPLIEQLISSYIGAELAWDVRFVLSPGESQQLKLDGSRRLGWTTWLQGADENEERQELVLRPDRPFRDASNDGQEP